MVYPDLKDGIYWFYIKARDGAGIWGEISHYQIKIDATGPENLSIDYPLSNYWHKEPVTNYYGQASDAVSGIDLSTLEYNYNNQGWKPVKDDAGAHDWDDLDEIPRTKEEATLQIRAKDMAGNPAVSAVKTIKVDLGVLPVRDLVSLTHPDPTKWYPAGNPEFNWEAPADESGIEGYSYLFDRTEGTIPDEKIDTTGTTASFKDKEDGVWCFHARAKDKAGNWGKAAHLKVQIDTTPPEVLTIDYPLSNKCHTENITKYYGRLSDSTSGIDLSALEYSYNGSEWIGFGDDSGAQGWNDQDQIPHTFQTEGATLQVRAKDMAGNLSRSGVTVIRVQRFKIDTKLLTRLVLDEGEFTQDGTRLACSFSEMPKAEEYQYCLGAAPGERDVIGWTSVGQKREVVLTGLDLKEGETYYFAVRARKKKFLVLESFFDLGISDGITFDSTPPDKPLVMDDGEQTANNRQLHFRWSSSDKTSGIRDYLYALGTTPEGTDLLNWKFGGQGQELLLTDLSLEDGKTCYLSVKAIDKAGNESLAGVSDGITVADLTAPIITAIQDEGDYTTDGSQLSFSFKAEDEESEVVEYQYAIGTSPESDDLTGWKKTIRTEVTEKGLRLSNGQSCYITVKARNKAGLWSSRKSSDGLILDATPPLVPQPPSDEGNYSKKAVLTFAWSPASDPETGIENYRLQVGTKPRAGDLFDAEVPDVTTKEVTPGKHGQTYYARIKAKNKAGLWSAYTGSSDGITIDLTPPSAPIVRDDGETTKDAASLHAVWSCQDDESGVVEYQYALGTTPRGGDLLNWTSSLETEIRAANLSLSPGRTYYVSVRAKNGAGLWSEAGTSDGIMVEVPQAVKEIVVRKEAETTIAVEAKKLKEESGPAFVIGFSNGAGKKREEKVEAKVEVETAPTPLAKETPKEEWTSLGKGGLEMTVGVYEDPGYTKLYVRLKNKGDKIIYAGLSDFILLTKDGKVLRPGISRTYITKDHFSPGPLTSNSKVEGFIIFETKDLIRSLTFKASFGNEVLVEFP